MGTILELVITLTIGSVLIVNGVAVRAEDILASAQKSANVANVHQLSLALELYYLDHNTYPQAADGAEMVEILAAEKYIQSLPTDPSVFAYNTIQGGNDYKLALK